MMKSFFYSHYYVSKLLTNIYSLLVNKPDFTTWNDEFAFNEQKDLKKEVRSLKKNSIMYAKQMTLMKNGKDLFIEFVMKDRD